MDHSRRGAPVYQRAADILRDRIVNGHYSPRIQLPAERALALELGISHSSLRKAIAVLRGEGLLECQRGYRAKIRPQPTRAPVQLEPGQMAVARMPTALERDQRDIPDGVPILLIGDQLYPAHQYAITR